MREIKNYKLKDFLKKDTELIESYQRILKHLKPIDTKYKLQDLTFRQVETIKQGIDDPETLPEVFEYIHGMSGDEFENIKIIDFYGLYNGIIKQIENLLGMEEQELTSIHSDTKWELVEGSKRLSVMGILPTVDNLAGGDILKYEQVLDLPYLTVFNKLRMERIKSDIEKDMNKIKIKQD